MKYKHIWMFCILMAVMVALSTSAFAIDETEVESAIAASSKEELAGSVFIWFLCAIAFLKISQKIDSFMSSLGINVGRTGGSMLGELMIAGKAIGAAVKATGGAIGSVVNHNHSSSSTTNRAAGQGFTGVGNGLIGVAHRAAGNAALLGATGRGSSLSGAVGSAMFASSLKSGGKLASNVVGAVATGSIATMGSITGKQASDALTSYLGYSSDQSVASENMGQGIGMTASGDESDSSTEDRITLNGGVASGALIVGNMPGATEGAGSIPGQPPTFRNVEIGGGRITGYETPASGGAERQFAMYNAEQYMEPVGSFETVQTVDGQSWYKQYAEPTVRKTPYKDDSGKIQYDEKIVEQLPQIPKRKDRV